MELFYWGMPNIGGIPVLINAKKIRQCTICLLYSLSLLVIQFNNVVGGGCYEKEHNLLGLRALQIYQGLMLSIDFLFHLTVGEVTGDSTAFQLLLRSK